MIRYQEDSKDREITFWDARGRLNKYTKIYRSKGKRYLGEPNMRWKDYIVYVWKG
jgi:hypothetical protein